MRPKLELLEQELVERIVGEASKDNARMLATFRNRGFELDDTKEEDVVLVTKEVE